MNIIEISGERLLFFLFNNCQVSFIDQFKPSLSWASPRTVLCIKLWHLRASHVLLDEDETSVCQTCLTASEEVDKVIIGEVAQHPLTPDSVIATMLRNKLVQTTADVAVDPVSLRTKILSSFV